MKFLPLCTFLVGGQLALVSAGLWAAELVLVPDADAFVRDNMATSSFGLATSLKVNDNNGVRVSFLRFDLSGIAGAVSRLRLELVTYKDVIGGSQNFNIYGLVAGENWGERTITWANAPGVVNSYSATSGSLSQILDTVDLYGAGAVLASFASNSSPGSTDTFFDVSNGPIFEFVAADSDKVITFIVAENSTVVDNADIGWNSRETAATTKLTVTTVPEPSAALLGSGGGILPLLWRRRWQRAGPVLQR